ncbi:hypothetical protein J6590_007318 [Homalodisca vitripennis]|nr:hypothetical protein J6590_007318 [Homalodisca vitripennis]
MEAVPKRFEKVNRSGNREVDSALTFVGIALQMAVSISRETSLILGLEIYPAVRPRKDTLLGERPHFVEHDGPQGTSLRHAPRLITYTNRVSGRNRVAPTLPPQTVVGVPPPISAVAAGGVAS